MADQHTPLEQIYLFWLERAHKTVRKATTEFFKEMNIELTVDQWTIIKRLYEGGSMTQKQLADTTYKDPASITRSLDLLEKRGVISRTAYEKDRRLYLIEITSEGKQLVDRVLPEAVKLRNRGIEGLNRGELETFKKVLATIEKNMQKE